MMTGWGRLEQIKLVSIPGMLQEQLQHMATDVELTEEIHLAVTVKVSRINSFFSIMHQISEIDDVYGRCCGGGSTGGGCGGYANGWSALDHYKDGFFGNPKETKWTRKNFPNAIN